MKSEFLEQTLSIDVVKESILATQDRTTGSDNKVKIRGP